MHQNARLVTTSRHQESHQGPVHRPETQGLLEPAQEISQTETGTISRAIKQPGGLARHDCPSSPRENQAERVVIPHEGQRRPVRAANAQGARPSWV